jgi:hypothetical protein
MSSHQLDGRLFRELDDTLHVDYRQRGQRVPGRRREGVVAADSYSWLEGLQGTRVQGRAPSWGETSGQSLLNQRVHERDLSGAVQCVCDEVRLGRGIEAGEHFFDSDPGNGGRERRVELATKNRAGFERALDARTQ